MLRFIRKSTQLYTFIIFFEDLYLFSLACFAAGGVKSSVCNIWKLFPKRDSQFILSSVRFVLCFFFFFRVTSCIYKLTPIEGLILHSYERYMCILVYQLLSFIVLEAVAFVK